MQARHHAGIILVGLSAVAWSTAGIFTKGITADVWAILFWRGIFSALFIALYVAWREGRRTPHMFASLGFPSWAVASIGSIATICYLSAFKFTTVTNVVVIYATTPFIAAGLGWLAMREEAARTTLLASAVTLVGVAVMMGGSFGKPNLIGDFLAIAMAFFMAVMMVLIRKFPNAPMVPAMCMSSTQIALIALVVSDPFDVSSNDMWWLVMFGVIQAFGAILLTEGTRLIPAAQAALVGSFDIPLAPFWAWLILAEIPASATFLGGAVVLAAVAYFMTREWNKPPE